MSNFAYLFENMDRNRRSEEQFKDEKALEAIKMGINIREDFWQDFLMLLNDTESLSALLGIPAVKMNKWYSRVGKYLAKHYDTDDGTFDIKKKRKLIDTKDFDEEDYN